MADPGSIRRGKDEGQSHLDQAPNSNLNSKPEGGTPESTLKFDPNFEARYTEFLRYKTEMTDMMSGREGDEPFDTNLLVTASARLVHGPRITRRFDKFLTDATQADTSGGHILSRLLTDQMFGWVTYVVEAHFDSIATDKYEWVQDLKDARCSEKEIVQSLIESAEASPWVPYYQEVSDSQDTESDQILPDFHLPNCVHSDSPDRLVGRGGDASEFHRSVHGFLNLGKAEIGQRLVAEYCGLAGVFPPNHPNTVCGHTRFDNGLVEISYGDMESVDSDVDSKSDPRELVKQILLSARGVSKAIRVLQRMELCCNRLTCLRKEESGEIRMVDLRFKELIPYFGALEELDGESLEDPAHLFKCTNLSDELLHSLFPGFHIRGSEVLGDKRKLPRESEISDCLHKCSLLTQVLGMVVLSYSQAHTGELWPPLLREPLTNVLLSGSEQFASPKARVIVEYQQLACMGDFLGDNVLVFQGITGNLTTLKEPLASGQNGALLRGCIEDIIDSWGPGVLLSQPGSSYGEAVHSVMIGGGTLAPLGEARDPRGRTLYHWGQLHDAPKNGSKCTITDSLVIGAIAAHTQCPLNFEECRRASESYLDHIGTEPDYWRLAERQMMIQGGQYVGIQMGNVYSKIKGRSLKKRLLDYWAMMPDLRVLLQPWGLQISLCTGVARRVSLKALIEEPMFAYIDGLNLKNWDAIKTDMRLAFQGEIDDFTNWAAKLQDGSRECAIKVITVFLEILKDTGLDRDGKSLRLLWPHKSSLSHSISLKCGKSNLWARVLKDSPSCATFATVTMTCLEAPGHVCKKDPSPVWTGQGGLLSTAVSAVRRDRDPSAFNWELKNGQQCWIERAGGEVWVYTTKESNSEAQLRVKINRFPKGLSIFRDWQVLRERQDATFEAEEVVVFGTMA